MPREMIEAGRKIFFAGSFGDMIEIRTDGSNKQLIVTEDTDRQISLTMNSREFERFLEWMIGISVDTDILEDSGEEDILDEEDIMGYKN